MNAETEKFTARKGRRLVSTLELCEMLNLSRAALHKMRDPGHVNYDATFPRGIRLGTTRSVRFDLTDVDAWLDAQKALQAKQRRAS